MYRNNPNESAARDRQDTAGSSLNKVEFWVDLAREIPWKLFEDQFAAQVAAENLDVTPTQQIRMLLGAIIIQEVEGLNEEQLIACIEKDPYLQYFIGLKEFCNVLPFDLTQLNEFRHCITSETMAEIIEFIERVKSCDQMAQPVRISAPVTLPEEPPETTLAGVVSKEAEESQGFDFEDGVPPFDPLEHTQKMPVLIDEPVETEFGSELAQNQGSQDNGYWKDSFFQLRNLITARVKSMVDRIRQVNSDIRRKYMEKYEPRPEIQAGLETIKKGCRQFLSRLQELTTQLRFLDKSWIKITMIALAVVLVVFTLVLIWLPVPAPRMLIASEVYDTHHKLAATFYSENRRPVKLKEVPLFLRNAVLAVEDHRFYKHQGINPGRIIKAAVNDFCHGSLEQGGSTITQQLVKNVYLSSERTFSRKFQELLYSIKLEYKLSKDQIFELYLNKIYFGHGAYGIKVAAETYFQKELKQLNQAEMALLAGLPRGPAFYSPYNHPVAARQRLCQCLLRMKECGYITVEQYQKYSQQKLDLPGIKTKNNTAPYFMDLLQDEIARIFPNNSELIYTSGLKIESTLDLEVQKAASKAFRNGLPVIYRPKGGLPQPQGALIAINPKNGEIRALLGGTDYSKSQFNRAIQAKRQPGSAFKPILYTAAFQNGFTLASQIDRSPKTYYISGQAYCPTDHHSGRGNMSLRNALAQSSNVVAVKLIERIGFKPVLNLADKLGVKSQLRPTLSLALGACEVTPLELATAYATLANGGICNKPITIRRILNAQGRVLYQAKPKGIAVIDPAYAFLSTQAMCEVMKSGTAAAVGWQFKRPVAGKTGTTNSNRDTWFVGYTPDLLACVFVGCDNYERTLPGMASQVAAPLWGKFMSDALKGKPVKDFAVPANIKKVSLCKLSGKLAKESCSAYTEYFVKGTEPTDVCSGHLRPLLKKIFNIENSDSEKLEASEAANNEKEIYKTSEKEKESTNTNNDKHGKIRGLFERIWKKIK